MKKYKFYEALKQRRDLQEYGSNRLALFALQMYFNLDDVSTIASEEIVDGSGDCGIDLIHIDEENRIVVIAQAYESNTSEKDTAKTKKVSVMTQGITKLINSPLDDLPPKLKSSAEHLMRALKHNNVDNFYIWYVHNVRNSETVKKELNAVEKAVKLLLPRDNQVKEIVTEEIGVDKLEEMFKSRTVSIYVTDHFEVEVEDGFYINEEDWESYVTSIPGEWLLTQYKKYKEQIFSSNVRDFLGLQRINIDIKDTAKNNPGRFWVYNNGITILVKKFKVIKYNTICFLSFDGLSILNGAQTTGSIGLLESVEGKLKILTRFIKCKDKQTVKDIKKYNNTQNKIIAADFKSNDPTQNKLLKEFNTYPSVKYIPRRGGIEEMIKRPINSLSSVLASQILAAFHGSPEVAYHQKTKIWEDETLYFKYFRGATASHIFFIFALYVAIRRKKTSLLKESKINKLTKLKEQQLLYFETRGSMFLFLLAIKTSLEDILGISITNYFKLSFNKNVSFNRAVQIWSPIIDIACNFTPYLQEGLKGGAIRDNIASEAVEKFHFSFAGIIVSSNKIISSFARFIATD